MGYFKELSDVSRTQVIVKGINLKDFIKTDLLDELKDKFSSSYEDIIVPDITFLLIPKEEPLKNNESKNYKPKDKKQDLVINIPVFDIIRFEQPSIEHYKEKTTVITVNKKDNLDKVLK